MIKAASSKAAGDQDQPQTDGQRYGAAARSRSNQVLMSLHETISVLGCALSRGGSLGGVGRGRDLKLRRMTQRFGRQRSTLVSFLQLAPPCGDGRSGGMNDFDPGVGQSPLLTPTIVRVTLSVDPLALAKSFDDRTDLRRRNRQAIGQLTLRWRIRHVVIGGQDQEFVFAQLGV